MNNILLLFPVFGIIAFGYILCRYQIAKPNWIKFLNFFVYYISLPALILSLFWKIEFTQSTLSFFGFHAGFIVALSLLLLALLSVFKIDNQTKVAVILGAVVGNTIYMGYPILRSSFPNFPIEISMGAGSIQLIIGLLVAMFFVEYLVLKSKKLSTYFSDIAKNPLMIAVILGIILSFAPHNQTTNTIFNLLSNLGGTASPLALFTLGVFMYRKFSKQSWLLGSIAILIKLIIFPIIILLAFPLFGFNNESTQVSVLISTMPTAITSFVLAEKYNLNKELTADIILISTLLSIVSIPLVIWFMN